MKKSFFFAILLFFCSIVSAQELLVQNNEKGLYLLHTVNAKENFYSIGRLYNIPPKDIAAMNGLEMANGLSIGQTIQVPLNSANFAQDAEKGRPVYYVVGEKEGLYRVSTRNNGVLMASLRKWNKLASDNISMGQKLIVGFLVSPEANNIVATVPPPAETSSRPVQTSEPVTSNSSNTSNNTNNTSVNTPVQDRREETQSSTPRPTTPPRTATNDGNGGYFKTHFEQQTRNGNTQEQTLTSGIFKTSSGWQDTKYYALVDKVEPGTIVRITNPTNSKTVYAKVLDKMAGIRQNQGLDVRISSAAATVLGVEDTEKFIVKVGW
jgi:LysM repeat protein